MFRIARSQRAAHAALASAVALAGLLLAGCAGSTGADTTPDMQSGSMPAAPADSYVERTFSVPEASGDLPRRPEELGEPAPLEFVPPVPEIIDLPNGMKLFILEDHELPLVQVSFLMRVGNVADPPDKVSLGGFVADVMRRGGSESVSGDAFEDSLAYMATSMSFGMDVEFARGSMDATRQTFDASLSLFADAITNPAFPQEKLEEVKRLRLEAIRRRKDDPREIGRWLFREVVYGRENPYARLDNREDVAAITRQDLVEHHRTWFRPNITYMAISGDITAAEAVGKIAEAFQGWEAAGVPETEMPPTGQGYDPGVYIYPKELNQTIIRMGGTGRQRLSDDEHAVAVMNKIFGDGTFTSRLGLEVRSNRGLAYYVGGFVFDSPDPRQGMTLAVAGVGADKTHEAITVMRDIMAGMGTDPITDEEMERAKEMIINSFIFNFTSSEQIAYQQMWLAFMGYPDDYLETYIPKVRALTKDEVRQAARQYLSTDDLRILVVGNQDAFEKPLGEFGNITELETFEERFGE